MKIAILTQPLGHNFGGIMQAWALQQVLKNLNHIPITIDRQFDEPSYARTLANIAHKGLLKIQGRLKSPMFPNKILDAITINPKKFINKNINLSPIIRTTNQLRTYIVNSGFDAIIVGSDQVWRREYSPNIANYFLDFAEDLSLRRISYAASFGSDDWSFTKEQTATFSRLIHKFDMVSVREISAIEICRKWLETEAKLVLDPTLLLDENDYEKLIIKECVFETPYVYTYFLDNNDQKFQTSKIIASRLSLPIHNFGATGNLDGYTEKNSDNYIMPEVGNWLAGFKNASFVVTDSFHGMVFSIINRKPFLVIKNDDRGSARFDSLLASLGISGRSIHSSTISLDDRVYDPIEMNAYANLSALRKNSLYILEKSLI